jgi:hypothetical protein
MPEEKLCVFIAINTDSKGSGRVCNEYIDEFYKFFTESKADLEAEAALEAGVPLDMDLNRINGTYSADTHGVYDLTKMKSVLITSSVQCDKSGRLTYTADGGKWDFRYVGKGLFYDRESGIYCKLWEHNNRMILSILGMDFEKVDAADAALFKASIAGLPFFLAAVIVSLLALIRNRKAGDRKLQLDYWLMLAQGILVLSYYVLNGIMGLKSMNCDTYIVIKLLIPMIIAVCYITLALTGAAGIRLILSWIRKEHSTGMRVFSSIVVVFAAINIIFMYVMNGFRFWG